MKSIVSLVLISLSFLSVQAQQMLEYNLKLGDQFSIKQTANQVITQEIEGTSHEIVNSIDGILAFEVVELTEEGYDLELVFKDLNLLMTSSIQGKLMDVKAKELNEDDIQSKIFNSILNNPVIIRLKKNGEIATVMGGDSLVSRMASASGIEDDFSLNMMKKSLEKEFGSKALSESYEQMTYIYPSTEVSVGDTWHNSYTGKLATENKWKLDAISKENATISGIAKVTMSVIEPSTTMNLTGEQTTQIETNTSNGLILKMSVEGLSSGVSTMAQLQGQEIPTTIKSTITYELINE